MPSKYLHRRIKHALRWEAAKWWLRSHPRTEVIGIAGSVGKTTTKDLTASVLAQTFPVIKTQLNYDPIFNLPQTALHARFGRMKFVAEMGIDAPGQMAHYLTLVHPKIGVMTELSLEHTDAEHLKSLDIAVAEEWELIKALPASGWAVLNGDNEHIKPRLGQTRAQQILIGFEKENDVRISDVAQSLVNHQPKLSFRLSGKIEGEFHLPILGRHNARCATYAVTVGHLLGMTNQQIQSGLEQPDLPQGRLQVKQTPWGDLIDDAYNASPKAVEAAIDVLVDLGLKDATFVLGDMLELGDYGVEAHREVGIYAAKAGIRTFLTYGPLSAEARQAYHEQGSGGLSQHFNDHQEIVDWLKTHPSSLILVKGSKGMKMGEVVAPIEKDALLPD